MANLAPLLGVQYFESLVYPNGQLPFWGSGTGVSMGAAVTEAAARKATSTMIDLILLSDCRAQTGKDGRVFPYHSDILKSCHADRVIGFHVKESGNHERNL
jgi:hypothetical protein